jgi:LysR family transcriptional regulator, glycine cleavage system transcriptional activator
MAFRLPPLSAVRLFEAAARSLNFKTAADEVHVTPSAISHGVQTLEEWLGAELFVRGQRSLALTDAGRAFLQPVQEALAGLAQATEHMPGRRASGTLTVSVAPTFGSRWLIPRLVRFAARYPDITVVIDTERRHVDLSTAGIDLAVRMAQQRRPSGIWLRLFRETLVPVCSPELLARHDSGSMDQMFLHAPLLHVTSTSEDWEWWFAQSDIPSPSGSHQSLRFDTIRMAIDAAIGGLGIALGRKPLINDDLVARRLLEIAGPPRQGLTGYWLVGEEATFRRPEARLFRRWLMEEIENPRPPPGVERTQAET